MISFLVAWAEQLIIALVVIVIIEIVLPTHSNYKKYIKVILGIFLLYTIINPLIGAKFDSFKFKEIVANTYNENKEVANIINYDEEVEKNFKTNFESNLKELLSQNGYRLIHLKQEIEYKNNEIEIKQLIAKVEKQNSSTGIVEKVDVKKKDNINNDEIENIQKIISDNYSIDTNKIIIESEKKND